MFDIAWGEFVVIAVVALIVIGPKELPGVLRAIGQWTTKIRRMAAEFQSQFQEALREAEMADLKKEVDSATKGFTSQFSDPLNFEESAKWEPKPEAVANPDNVAKPTDVPQEPALVASEGHAAAAEAAPAAAEHPPVEPVASPSADGVASPPPTPTVEQKPLAQASGQPGHEEGVHS